MRLIDADELKKAFKNTEYFNEYAFGFICDIIDNAPTINPSLNLDNITEEDIEKFKIIWQRANSKGMLAINEDRPKSGDLISREKLREQIDDCKYFNSSFQKMTVAEFLTIVHDIIGNAPTLHHPNCDICEDKAKQYSLGFQDGYMTGKKRPQVIDNCDMNIFEPERYKEGEDGES